ncbi:MAG: aldehyde dehydrogenase family protein [Amphritea sp.]
MENNDNQHVSLQVQQLFDQGHQAANAYAGFNKSQVERVVKAVAEAAAEKAEFYAEWAVRETGFGNVADKTAKNMLCSAHQLEANNIADYVDVQVDKANKLVRVPKPAGVVIALAPSTNPVATVFFKSMISLMSRNAVILCPHPGAKECCTHAAEFLAEVAEKAGAPKGIIQTLRNPSIPLVSELMQSERASLILATGGPAMVRAAYSSSNPAIGVGAGNVACYVHETAELQKAAAQIVVSKSFDNSVPCTCESVVLADQSIADELKQALVGAGAHVVSDAVDEQKLRVLLFPEGKLNPAVIGKSAQWIADQAGIAIDAEAKVIVAEISEVGRHEPMSKEKMFPVLGFIRVDGVAEASRTALAMLDMMGAGHSAVVHANDPNAVVGYGAGLPVCRVTVNAPGVLGNSGMVNGLNASPVIGTGFFGRSSVSENIAPKHLIQWTQLAYPSDPTEVMGEIDKAVAVL